MWIDPGRDPKPIEHPLIYSTPEKNLLLMGSLDYRTQIYMALVLSLTASGNRRQPHDPTITT